MLPWRWSKPFCSPKIWWSCEALGGVKSSFIQKGSWAWYVLIFPGCFFFFFFYWTQHSFLLFRFKAVQSTFRLEEMASFLLLRHPVSFFFNGRTRSSSLHYLFPFWFPHFLRITLFGFGG